LVPAAGVEPATFRSGGGRSNPLSYAGMGGGEKITQRIDRFEVVLLGLEQRLRYGKQSASFISTLDDVALSCRGHDEAIIRFVDAKRQSLAFFTSRIQETY
jgi:hypothetical protein